MGTLINMGGAEADRRDVFPGECHLWAASTQRLPHYAVQRLIYENAARVVVDLGSNHSKSGERAADFDPDILVLTHSDEDHIGGFNAVADNWPPRLRQVWVPYEWGLLASAWEALLDEQTSDSPYELTPEIVRALGETRSAEVPGVIRPRGDDFKPPQNGRRVDSMTVGSRIETAVEDAISNERRGGFEWPDARRRESPRAVARAAVKKAVHLYHILECAQKEGARVRYFSTDHVRDHDTPWLYEGEPSIATIANAVEVLLAPVRVVSPALTLYLAAELTAQNRRALATYLWDKSHADFVDPTIPCTYWDASDNYRNPCKPWGVLIWSDGGGESCGVGSVYFERDLVPWEHLSLMTAPHHGSAGGAHKPIWDAKAAYEDLTGRDIPVISVGGFTSQGTASEYIAGARHRRGCTRCRHAGETASKTVVVAVDGPSVLISPCCRE